MIRPAPTPLSLARADRDSGLLQVTVDRDAEPGDATGPLAELLIGLWRRRQEQPQAQEQDV